MSKIRDQIRARRQLNHLLKNVEWNKTTIDDFAPIIVGPGPELREHVTLREDCGVLVLDAHDPHEPALWTIPDLSLHDIDIQLPLPFPLPPGTIV